MADTRQQSPSKSSLTRQAGVVSVAEEEAVAAAAEVVEEPLVKTEEGVAFPKGSVLAEAEARVEERNRRHRRCLTNMIFQALAGPSPTNKTDEMATVVCA